MVLSTDMESRMAGSIVVPSAQEATKCRGRPAETRLDGVGVQKHVPVITSDERTDHGRKRPLRPWSM